MTGPVSGAPVADAAHDAHAAHVTHGPSAGATPATAPAAHGHDAEASSGHGLITLGRFLLSSGYAFTTPTPATHERVNRRAENAWGDSPGAILGWSRPFRRAPATEQLLSLMTGAGVAVQHLDGWRSTVRASTLDGYLVFHSAWPTVAADAVFFGPDTYRFVRAVKAELRHHHEHPVYRAIEIGCGAGPAAIAIARAFPRAEVIASDINDQALHLAAINAQLAGTPNLRTCHSDLLSGVEGQFDLIVANPPYLLDPEARTYRHGGGDLGGALSLRIVEQAVERLAPGGRLLLYTGVAIVQGHDAFRDAAVTLLEHAGMPWQYDELDPDVFGEELDTPAYRRAERIAAVLLVATRHGAPGQPA